MTAVLESTLDVTPTPLSVRIDAREQFAKSAIDGIGRAARHLGHTTHVVLTLEDGRAMMKSAAIRRLMEIENPETKKVHSASSAEKVVELDEEYAAYRAKQADAEVSRIEAQGAYDAAVLNARFELARFMAAVTGDSGQ